jgi:nicotinamidase-related amidase
MLNIDHTALLVIDVQGKLAQLMHDKEKLFANLARIIRGARVLELPIIWTEQVPEKLGQTTPEIADLLDGSVAPLSKASFSCCGAPPFMTELQALNRKQLLLTGIETHICLYQTSVDLLKMGYEVQVVADAVSSRTAENKQVGLARIKAAGAVITSTEMALFELLRMAEGDQFRQIAKIVK